MDYQYYSYNARVPNEPGRIEFQVQDTSRYFLPAETFIDFEGRLLKLDNIDYGIGDQVSFVNNGTMAFFKSSACMIDGREIDACHSDIDVATTILGLARYGDDYSRSADSSMMFAKYTTDYQESRMETIGNVRNAAGDSTIPAVLSMNENFNLGFASLVV